MDKKNYIYIKIENKFVLEHRIIAEKVLNRKLKKNEIIHHKDLNKKNNNPSNLALFENQNSHRTFHNKLIQFGMTNPIKNEMMRRSISC